MIDYFTKTELQKRWSNSLIDKHFPICSMEKPNPHYKCAAPMQLYLKTDVAKIESTESFKKDMAKVAKRKIPAQKVATDKRQELLDHINSLSITLPDLSLDEVIKRACSHYNNWHRYDEYDATPYSAPIFLKRITTNYLRHCCTKYERVLDGLYGKVGRIEAYNVLKKKINDTIYDKYTWLQP